MAKVFIEYHNSASCILTTIKVFDQIEEKPHIEHAQRVGTHEAAMMMSHQRAIKVKLTSKISAMTILRKAALLKTAHYSYYSQIYVSPDRSPEQRAIHKELLDKVFRSFARSFSHVTNANGCLICQFA